MYQTKLTKEQLAYNIAYHLEKETDKPIHEVILEALTAYEENLKRASRNPNPFRGWVVHKRY